MDEDFQLAVQLQELYNQEETDVVWKPSSDYGSKSKYWDSQLPVADTLSRPSNMSVVDPSWELLDPSPDIHALFLQFNDTFFWGKLTGVEVKWSPRMTLCAGVCCYEGRGGLCSIRLSKPLLTLRPRKDLVETLLHEMIHALLFVTHNNKDRDSHGPEFCKHMNRINSATGAKISVYHSFHDEVDEYRKHWWLCNGPCQKRRPYFGYVKRAMNRAPSSLDPWWAEHQRTCGGTFIKVKEPENTSLKGKKKVEASESRPGKLPVVKGLNKVGTEKVGETILDEKNKHSDYKGKSNGVDIRTFMPFSGTGHKLGERSPALTSVKVQSANSSSSEPVKSDISINTILNYSTLKSNINYRDLKPKMPKVSVANTKVFINVSGSPVKLPFNGKQISRPRSPVPKHGNSSASTQKIITFEMPSSSQSAPPTIQASNTEKHQGRPPKRPRLDEKNIKDFFSSTGRNITGGSSLVIDERSSVTIKVNCPICQEEVSEDKINDHLDSCLAI